MKARLRYIIRWFYSKYLRQHRLFYKPTTGQVETIIKMCEYCRENRVPYRHILHTILRDWENVYGRKVDWERLRGNQSERKDDDDMPF